MLQQLSTQDFLSSAMLFFLLDVPSLISILKNLLIPQDSYKNPPLRKFSRSLDFRLLNCQLMIKSFLYHERHRITKCQSCRRFVDAIFQGGKQRYRELKWLAKITQPSGEWAGPETQGTEFLGQYSSPAFSWWRSLLINRKVSFVASSRSENLCLYLKASLCRMRG
jgi:hypothetical protein